MGPFLRRKYPSLGSDNPQPFSLDPHRNSLSSTGASLRASFSCGVLTPLAHLETDEKDLSKCSPMSSSPQPLFLASRISARKYAWPMDGSFGVGRAALAVALFVMLLSCGAGSIALEIPTCKRLDEGLRLGA